MCERKDIANALEDMAEDIVGMDASDTDELRRIRSGIEQVMADEQQPYAVRSGLPVVLEVIDTLRNGPSAVLPWTREVMADVITSVARKLRESDPSGRETAVTGGDGEKAKERAGSRSGIPKDA